LSLDQNVAVEQIATSGRRLDVLVGPAGTGKSTTMAGLRAVWEAEHGAGSVLGLAPSAAAAKVLADELGIDTENTAKWLYEQRQEAERLHRLAEFRAELASAHLSPQRRSATRLKVARAEAELARWQLRGGQLVIVDEASLAGTFGLDELVSAAGVVGTKVVLVGDDRQISAVEAGGMFAALVRDRDGLAPALSDVCRFTHIWEKEASVELRAGSPDAVDAYAAHGRISEGSRDEMLNALYLEWKEDTEAGRTSLMISETWAASASSTAGPGPIGSRPERSKSAGCLWPAGGRPGWATRWSPVRTTGDSARAKGGSATATSGP
jgi:hypothetical protein